MPKKKLIRDPLVATGPDGLVIKKSAELRKRVKQYYVEKCFNKWMNKFTFDGLDYQQIRYMMKRFWMESGGSCAFYKLPMTENEEHPQGELIITPFSPAGVYNIYDFPTQTLLVNTRGVSFIPSRPLNIDEEVVIGYINRNHKGVYSLIANKIDELVDIDMAIRGNLKALKTPWMIAVTPENKKIVKEFYDNLDSDDPYLFVTIEDIQNAKSLVSGASLYIDKFEVKRQQVEDEINTMLGFDTVGIMNKKEHLTVGEVEMNGEQTNAANDIFLDSLNEIFTRVKDVLGYTVIPALNKPEMVYNDYEEEEDDTDEDGI